MRMTSAEPAIRNPNWDLPDDIQLAEANHSLPNSKILLTSTRLHSRAARFLGGAQFVVNQYPPSDSEELHIFLGLIRTNRSSGD